MRLPLASREGTPRSWSGPRGTRPFVPLRASRNRGRRRGVPTWPPFGRMSPRRLVCRPRSRRRRTGRCPRPAVPRPAGVGPPHRPPPPMMAVRPRSSSTAGCQAPGRRCAASRRPASPSRPLSRRPRPARPRHGPAAAGSRRRRRLRKPPMTPPLVGARRPEARAARRRRSQTPASQGRARHGPTKPPFATETTLRAAQVAARRRRPLLRAATRAAARGARWRRPRSPAGRWARSFHCAVRRGCGLRVSACRWWAARSLQSTNPQTRRREHD